MQNHLFMTYGSGGGAPMSAYLKGVAKDSLVLDLHRRSIYAQNLEFGYICNTTQEVTVRNSAGNDSATLILNVDHGVISLTQYIPVSWNKGTFSVTTNHSGNSASTKSFIAELGDTVTVSNFYYKFNGTGPCTEHSVTVTPKSSENTPITLINSTSDTDTVTDLTATITFSHNSTTRDTFTFSGLCSDSRVSNVASTFGRIQWLNHCYIGVVKGNHYVTIGDEIKAYTGGLNAFIKNTDKVSILYNKLTDNYRCGFDSTSNQISCNTVANEHFFIACPASVAPADDVVIGMLDEVSVEEFKKVNGITNSVITNDSGFSENYNIYVAVGDLWRGGKLYFR